MKKKRKSYNYFQKISSIFLMMVLFWLTISTPFVIAAQQELVKQQKAIAVELPVNDGDDDATEDDSNSIEEKVPVKGTVLSDEFLHDHYFTDNIISKKSVYHKLENADSYIAFHGELLVPPPNHS